MQKYFVDPQHLEICVTPGGNELLKGQLFIRDTDVDAEIKALKARIKMQSGLIEKGKKKYRTLLAERKVVRGMDVRVGVEQPDGEIKWFDGSVSGERVKFEPEPVATAGRCGPGNPCAYPKSCGCQVVTERCELGEHCRCDKGDEPGCWNLVSV